MKKQLTNKVSTEDLLKALDNTETEVITAAEQNLVYKNDVPAFFSKYNIGPGEHKIRSHMLYRLYCRFSADRVSRYEFSATATLFLNNENTCFFIDKPRDEVAKMLTSGDNRHWSKYSPAHPATRKHFEDFHAGVGLERGNKWVETFVLNAIYKKWCKANRKISRFKPQTFTRMMNMYFEQRRTAFIENWFRVNESVLDYLTPAEKQKVKDDRSKAKKEKQKG